MDRGRPDARGGTIAVTTPGQPIAQEELAAVEPRFLLAVDLVGVTLRWADVPLTVTDDNGAPVYHAGGFDLEYEDALSMFSASEGVTVPVRGIFPPPDVDVADLVQRGHTFEGAIAEVAIWLPGRTYEERAVLVRGRISMPEYGTADEPLSFSVVAQPGDERATVPEPEARVSDDSWTDYDPNVRNRLYPIVFGTPGKYLTADGTDSRTAGSPALYVDDGTTTTERVLIAGHRTYAPNSGTTVRLVNLTTGATSTFTPTHEPDASGRLVTVCDVSGWGVSSPADGDDLWCVWRRSAYGALDFEADGTSYEGAGDLITWMLRRSSLAHDVGAWRAVRDQLNSYQLSGYIDEPVRPYEWLRANVFPLLPLSIRRNASGVSPVLWRYDVPRAESVAHLREGLDLMYQGPVRIEGYDRIANEVTIEYVPRNDTASSGDQYLRSLTITGRDVTPTEAIYTTQHTRSSHLRYGRRVRTVQSDLVWRASTAGKIAGWMTRAYSHPWRVISYSTPTLKWAALRPGQIVTLTHSALYFDEQPAIVRRVQWTGGDVRLEIMVLWDEAQDIKPTG